MTDDLSNYVTRAELAGYFGPLAEIRTMLRDDMSGLHEGQRRLTDQVTNMGQEITTRMDEANHRTTKAEEALEAVAEQVTQAQKGIDNVNQHGCATQERHTVLLTQLVAAGVSPTTGEVLAEGRGLVAGRLQWTPAHKATVVGAVLTSLAIGALAPFVIPVLHTFIHWLLGTR